MSSQQYKKHRDENRSTHQNTDSKIDWTIVGLMERCIFDRVKNDIFYEDRDILQGIERKINACEHPEITQEVLLNRSGVIESSLDELIKTLQIEDHVKFSNQYILHALQTYARLVRRLGTSRKGGQRYINSLKERVAESEEEMKKEKSEGEDVSGYPLITLPFGQ
jgi:hypothetical protein